MNMNTPDYWLDTLLECNRRDFTPSEVCATDQPGPTGSSRSFAIALRAMAHAYFLNGPLATPFASGITIPTVPSMANPSSALRGAALAVLTRLFPHQADRLRQTADPFPSSDPASERWGEMVGTAHFMDRETDGSKAMPVYAYQQTAGAYQHDPEHPMCSPVIPAGPHWGKVKPFAVRQMLPLNPPPGYVRQGEVNVSDPDYLKDYSRVRQEGSAANVSNTKDQAGINRALSGIFWAYDGVAKLGTPPRLYFQVIKTVVNNFALSDERRMMTYAVCGTALGDAGIHAWHYKYAYNLWRPVTGVREHDASLGLAGQTVALPSGKQLDGDPFWKPLGAPRTNGAGKNFTPPFPAYPSGHATFGAASLHALRKMLATWFREVKLGNRKDNIAFDFVSDELNGINQDVTGNVRPRHQRHFNSLEDAIVENGISRVNLGVHWVFDAELKKTGKVIGGIPLGISIADDICKTYAGPISAAK